MAPAPSSQIPIRSAMEERVYPLSEFNRGLDGMEKGEMQRTLIDMGTA